MPSVGEEDRKRLLCERRRLVKELTSLEWHARIERALADALPLLQRADKVMVFGIDTRATASTYRAPT